MGKQGKGGIWLVFVLLLGTVLLEGLAARAQNFRGSLVGEVVDTTGARVPAAKITVRSPQSSVQRETTADPYGEFRIDDLAPGPYHVTVSAPGFADARAEVTVAVSSAKDIKVTMKPAAARETVTVQGQASSIATEPIDVTSAVHGGTVSAQDLQTIPLAQRSFANIAFLVPGTEPVEPSDPTKARITAVSFGGSSGLNDVLSVDGGDNSDDYIGGFLQNFSPDAIQEFAVQTSQENADTGRTVGGSVVITTKRGTNDWHGEEAFYERAAALNARYPIENPAPLPKQPFSRQNFVSTLGGPIVKNKLWFFASLEYVRENASIAYSPASLTQFNALASLASQGLIPGVSSISVPNNVPVPFRDYLGSARFDWAQSSRSQWFLRASGDNYTTHNFAVQQATLPSTGATWHNNYLNMVIGNQFAFSPTWLGSFTFDASGLHSTEERNSNFGFALAFPFSSTAQTISGFETFGDNQFVTPITAFPVLRNQEKYQLRYDVSHSSGDHAPRFGIDFIHEPVLSGALAATPETLLTYPNEPNFYAANPSQFYFSSQCATAPPSASGIQCSFTPAGNGGFSQSVQRLGLYVEDFWRVTPHLTIDPGIRYDTTFGLFIGSGRSQLENPAFLTLRALQIPLITSAPHDYRGQIQPRLGIAYSPGTSEKTVFRAGIGLYYNDLAQTGWVTALQAVNTPPGPCTNPAADPNLQNANDAGCIPGAAGGGNGAIIAPGYRTPYALHASAGVEHAFISNWLASADWTHETGMHGYTRYVYTAGDTLFTSLIPTSDPNYQADQQAVVPNLDVFRSDNRSRYDALSLHLQGNVKRRLDLVVNYTYSFADTWGCVLGELFDYVDGICNPLNPFGPGDYGPSGEDVRHRLVVAGEFHLPAGFEVSTLSQFESARPFTMTTPVDVNGLGDALDDRAVINGVQTRLDQFRGTPYMQVDMRVSRPFKVGERVTATPFIEFFNLFNRNNPGANFVTDLAALPTPANNLANATALCLDPPACTNMQAITSLNQLRVPAGALGDFFGPGTTVGVPFAAQIGGRVTF
ncbi:MAG TPA: carboxypeptidase regulatory-like domain-containing protein [Candidatus Acidoferrales bacterium]|nr:carboxypeptidase regulatory-like domain-containing protein [Candidatus Acidoferrales bacterium]